MGLVILTHSIYHNPNYRDIEDFSNMQGPLAVQEYIQELIRKFGNLRKYSS